MPSPTGRAFNEWLRAQLKAKKMSQRQLAQQSGVDHSTISRLVRGDRMPSLGTATKLARGLRELTEEDDGPQYLGLMNGGATHNPTARVEYALRADEALGEAQVRQVMEYYLAVRLRHGNRTPAVPTSPTPRTSPAPTPLARSEPPAPFVRSSYAQPAVAVGAGRGDGRGDGRTDLSARATVPTFRRLPGRGV